MEFTHTANPVRVSAVRILEITDQDIGDITLRLSDGRNYTASSSMTARHYPVIGDYLVTQEDGYEYLNPKDVFERKYSPGTSKSLIVITVQDGPGGAVVSLAAEPALDMSAAPTTQAQTLAHLMLGALPLNPPESPSEKPPANDAADGLAEPGPNPDEVPHSTESLVQ